MKRFCCALLCACVLLCGGCSVSEMSTLRDVTRPYAAEYKCERLTLGGEDMLGKFEFCNLELRYDGAFRFFYRDVEGVYGEYAGSYEMGEDAITLKADAGGVEKRFVFPYRNGMICLRLPMGAKLLCGQFRAV